MLDDTNLYTVDNVSRVACRHCGGVHYQLSRRPQHQRGCDSVVAFSAERALTMARLQGAGEEACHEVTDITDVVLDASARKLPQSAVGSPLSQEISGMAVASA